MIWKSLILSAGALTVTALSTPAFAGTTIAIDRAKLSEPGEVAAVYETIGRAADRLCRLEHDRMTAFGPKARRVSMEQCVTEAIDRAVRSANAPELTAHHAFSARGDGARLIAER
ncbi:MAG: UrcA family protein [Caulobacterales bacterium]|nr:UrcA family protein [Caulobacterales bacterium]